MDIAWWWHIPSGLALLHAYLTVSTDDKMAKSANVPVALGAAGGMIFLDVLLNRKDRSLIKNTERAAFIASGLWMLVEMISLGEGNVVGGTGDGKESSSMPGGVSITVYLRGNSVIVRHRNRITPHREEVYVHDYPVVGPRDLRIKLNNIIENTVFPNNVKPQRIIIGFAYAGTTNNVYHQAEAVLKNIDGVFLDENHYGETPDPESNTKPIPDDFPKFDEAIEWDPKQ